MKKLLLIMLALTASAFAQNIYPNGDFENGGEAGGRNGGKCGHLVVGAKTHWSKVGMQTLEVEPFAKYELKCYAKGKCGSGRFEILHVFNNNCYSWFRYKDRYINDKNVPEWKEFKSNLIPIENTVTITPVAGFDAGDIDFYVDDVSVVKVMSPEEAIKELEASKLDTTARQVLMRWYVLKGDIAKAQSFVTPSDNREKAEYACFMAQQAKDVDEKAKYISQMFKCDCFQYPEGPTRFNELRKDIPVDKLISAVVTGLATNGKRQCKSQDAIASFVVQPPRTIHEHKLNIANMNACIAVAQRLDADRQAKDISGIVEKCEAFLKKEAQYTMEIGDCHIELAKHALTRNGMAVVLPDDATITEKRAAEQFVRNIEYQTGIELETVKQSELKGRFPIYIGRCPATTGIKVDYEYLKKDGIHIELTDKCLVLAGGQRGVLYAMYTFLQEQLGWRWFTKGCTTKPLHENFRIVPFKKVFVPAMSYRQTSYIQFDNPELCVALKQNGGWNCLDASWGDKYTYYPWVHSFDRLVPLEKYKDTHPEYYSEINGKRNTMRTQLCLTNPDVLKIALETARSWVEPRKDSLFALSISQNDWRNYCTCKNCAKLAEEEGSESGPLLHFVNAIARELAKDYPNLYIDTLAYQYTRKAPKHVKPEKNVIIRLCSIECCFSHNLATCENNETFVKDIEDWAKISNHLFVWDYTINFAHSTMPFPNLRVLQPNLKFYISHGVTGMYEQGNRFTRGGEFQDMRGYIIANMMWNPDWDYKKGIREFTDAFYGPGAPFIRDYIELMHDSLCSRQDIHVSIYRPPQYYLTDRNLLAQADALLTRAEEAAAGDPVYATRNAIVHMPIWYTLITLSKSGLVYDKDGNFVNKMSGDIREYVSKFEAAAKAVGMTAVRESYEANQYSGWIAKYKNMAKADEKVEVVTLKNKFGTMKVVPGNGGRIISYKYTTDGGNAVTSANANELFKLYGDNTNGFTLEGSGYEEFSTTNYNAPGFNEKYAVVERGDNFILMKSQKLINGRIMERRITLLPDQAGFKVSSTVEGTGALAMRAHPIFSLPQSKGAKLWYDTNEGIKTIPMDMSPTMDSTLTVNGRWGIIYPGNRKALCATFDTKEVEFCYFHKKDEERRLNLEQWGNKQNGKATLTNTFTFIDKP